VAPSSHFDSISILSYFKDYLAHGYHLFFNAVYGSLKMETDIGGIREMFFVNQVGSQHKISLHDKRDFLIEDRWLVEIGGKNKNDAQVRYEQDAYLILDNLKVGFGRKIPLYLFGFLY
jgi:uncharacterized protein